MAKTGPKTGLRKCRSCQRRLPYQAYPRGNAERGRLSTICSECHAARQLERERWEKNGRVCPRCGETRRFPGEISSAKEPVCKACQRERHRVSELKRRKRPEVREYYKQRMRDWRAQNRDLAHEAQRRYRAKIYADPDRAEEWRDHNRIYHRMWRQRKGIQVRTPSLEQYRKTTERGRYLSAVPARQLAAAVQKMVRWEDTEVVCERLGISSRTLREWQDARRSMAQFDLADRVLTHAGLHWWDVWDESNSTPEELERVAVVFEGETVAA